MLSVSYKFEAKILAIEEFYDLTTLSVADLIIKLQAQKQRNFVRSDEGVKGAFHAKGGARQK